MSPVKDKPSREYNIQGEKQYQRTKPRAWDGNEEQGRRQAWPASSRALGRNHALEARAGGSAGRGELNTSVPNPHWCQSI